MIDKNARREIIADIVALTAMAAYLTAFVVGIFDRSYQMPTGLNLIFGLAVSFFIGQRATRGNSKDENTQDGNSIQPTSNSGSAGDYSNVDSGRTGIPDAVDSSTDLARGSNDNGGIQRRGNSPADTSYHEGAD